MHSELDYHFHPVRSLIMRYQSILVLIMGFCGAFLLGLLLWTLTSVTLGEPPKAEAYGGASPDPVLAPKAPPAPLAKEAAIVPEESVPVGALAPLFAPEVLRWQTQIEAWAGEFGLDPNLVATVMQIESCGNPRAVSSAGAQGLFQVMPFHFREGEDTLDPDTNARRGLGFLLEVLSLTEGHVGMALAGYNGGQAAALGSWESWPAETRRYYRWGNGIYTDVSSGLADSPTLHDWLEAGGASLCRQAATELAR